MPFLNIDNNWSNLAQFYNQSFVNRPTIPTNSKQFTSFDDGFIRAESVGTLPKLNDIGLVGNYGSDIILTYLSILSKFR